MKRYRVRMSWLFSCCQLEESARLGLILLASHQAAGVPNGTMEMTGETSVCRDVTWMGRTQQDRCV